MSFAGSTASNTTDRLWYGWSMRDIVEVDRRSNIVKTEDSRMRDRRVDRNARDALDARRRAWQQGFTAGLEIAAQQLTLARGTRDLIAADEPTAPYPIVDPDLIVID